MYDEYFLPKSEFLKVTVDMFGDFLVSCLKFNVYYRQHGLCSCGLFIKSVLTKVLHAKYKLCCLAFLPFQIYI